MSELYLLSLLGLMLAFALAPLILFFCYVAARTEYGALRMAIILHKLGYGVISDILGEEAKNKQMARRAAARYILRLRNFSRLKEQYPEMRLAISVKPSQFGLKLDKKIARRHLLTIYKACLDRDIGMEIDIEGPETIEDTKNCVLPLTRLGNTFRQAVAANQSGSEKFFHELAKRGIKIRLVKGAYPGDYRDPDAIKLNYLRLTHIARQFHTDIAYGTHDLKLLREAEGIWPGTWQRLFGIMMFKKGGWIYAPDGEIKNAFRFLYRRAKEGVRPSVFLNFIRNIPEALLWRLRYAPFSFFY